MSLISQVLSFFRKRRESKVGSTVQLDVQREGRELELDKNRICPYCGGHKDKLELLCYYSNDGIMWSDYRYILPQVAVPSLVQKYPHCGKYYIIKASHVLIKDTADFVFVDPVVGIISVNLMRTIPKWRKTTLLITTIAFVF